MKEQLPDIQWGIDWRKRRSLEETCGKELSKLPDELPFYPSINRHQFMAFHNLGNVCFHRKERIKILWPDYQFHRWADRRLEGMSKYHWNVWFGPSASGKTVDAAVFGLEYWLEAPDRTAVIACSTTMKMLRMRIWGQLARWHQALPKGLGNVGELLDSVTRIRWKQGDDLNGIFGMAVEEGNIEEVVNNLIGIHTERVLLIIDEGQGIREAIMRATFNMAKNPRFDFLIMGNPDSLHSPLVKAGEPIDGWDSVVQGETEQWENLGGPAIGKGLTQFFDGRKSPASDSPEERARLHWMINDVWVDNHLKSVKGNLNDPTFWAQAIGWPPPMGLESTLLDDSILLTFHCKDKAVWTEGYRKFACLDPAFSGGDKAILQYGKYGQTTDDKGIKRWIVEFGSWTQVPIDAKTERPIHYQIVDYCKGECQKRQIRPNEFSLDSSGEGGGLKSIFEKEWGYVIGIESGGSPSELFVDGIKTAKESYDTRASELLFNLREFAMADGIRGLSNEAAYQACSRRTFYRNGKWCAEPKTGSKGKTDEKGRPVKGYRQRLGHSPDHLDAACVGIAYCRLQGAEPTASRAVVPREPEGRYEDEFSESNYLTPHDYSYVA